MNDPTLLALTVAVVSAHLPVGRLYQSLGAALARTRARRSRGARGAVTLRSPARVALVTLSIAVVVLLAGEAGEVLRGFDWVRLAVLVALGAPAGAGCYLLVYAARLESRGRLRPARRLAATAGRSAFAGAMLLTGAVGLTLVALLITTEGVAEKSRIAAATAGALAVGSSGFVALMAGLSGKPRPACYLAVPLLLIGLRALVAAAVAG